MRDMIIVTCGGTTIETCNNKLVDPCLRLYIGTHKMCTTGNENLDKGYGNGTCCHVVGIKLNANAPRLQRKNWDGVKLYCVSARDITWVEFEHYHHTKEIETLKAQIDELDAWDLSEETDSCQNKQQVPLNMLERKLEKEQLGNLN